MTWGRLLVRLCLYLVAWPLLIMAWLTLNVALWSLALAWGLVLAFFGRGPSSIPTVGLRMVDMGFLKR